MPSAILVDEEGFIDLDIPISDIRRTDSGITVVALGVLHDTPVGVRLEIGTQWRKQAADDAGNVHFYFGRIALLRTGVESDNLLRVLREAYGIGGPDAAFCDHPNTAAAGLNCDPGLTMTNGVHMKAFFDAGMDKPGKGGDPEMYAEIFVNVDLETGTLQLHEKDPEYRADLIAYLRGEAAK